MNEQYREQLMERMTAALAVSASDPARQELVRWLADQDAQTRTLWLELVREDERLRMKLSTVSEPSGLKATLLALPDQSPQVAGRVAQRWWPAAAAAMVALVLGIWMLWLPSIANAQAMERLALLAVDNHFSPLGIPIKSSDPQTVRQELSKGRFAFDVKIPSLPERAKLLGGRRCHLGTHGVAYTRWREGDDLLSVYQICAADYDLPDHLQRKVLDPKDLKMKITKPCSITFWSENECVYVLVRERVAEE